MSLSLEDLHSRKIAHQARKLTEMAALLKRYKEDKESLEARLKSKEVNLEKIAARHEFLKERVIQVHGKQALVNLTNHIDNPDDL